MKNPVNPEETMEQPAKEIRLLKPPVKTKAVEKWLRYWASINGQSGKGTPERKARARYAAQVRWAKHRKEPRPVYNPTT